MTGATPSLGEATRLWLRVGLTSFGGPAGQIAQMHRLLVEERKWISETRFLHALNFCMLLPGPEAQQLATYIGWLLHGTRGGVIAGVLFILPGFFVLVALSLIYVLLGEVPLVAGLFFGLKAAVLAIVIEALQRVAKRALRNRVATLLAAVAFAAIFAFGVPFPVVVAAAALIGWQGARTRPDLFLPAEKKDAAGLVDRLIEAEAFHTRPDLGRAIRIALACLLLWFGPLVLAALWLGADHVLVTAGL
ncbi:MAG: chromate transporter, partial [Alphaproteobacteria bacterium]|nr:chromate transporter [Alphaproteobacteria bacterium]